MILLANGCSWTWGGGLGVYPDAGPRKELDQLTWPKHLRDMLEADEFINLAMGCGSNQRIYRTTLDWILSQSEETLKNTVAVIQFTEEARYEYYVAASNDPYENLETGWVKIKADVQLPKDNFYHLSQDRLKYHSSDIQDMYMFITWCESLSSLFNHYGIKHYFWSMKVQISEFPPAYREYMFNNFPWIEWKASTDQNHWSYDRISEHDAHPSLLGHKQLAKYIYEAIKND